MRAMLFSLKPGQRFVYGNATYTRLGFGNADGEGDGALLLWFIGRKLLSPSLARELFLNSEWFFAAATEDGHVGVFTRDEDVEVLEPATPDAPLTPQENFILDMASCLNDAINNCTGLLRGVAERLDPSVTDDVHGSVRDFLLREVEDLQKKRRRGMDKIIAFAGGPEAYRDANTRWWKQDPILPASQP